MIEVPNASHSHARERRGRQSTLYSIFDDHLYEHGALPTFDLQVIAVQSRGCWHYFAAR